MPRPPSREPTDGELEILQVLWKRGPAEIGVVCAALRESRDVATTTVATMLKIMLDKKLVTRATGARGYRWAATVTERATRRRLIDKLIDTAFGGSERGFFAHLLEDGNLSREDWDEIQRMLDVDASGRQKKRGER